MYLFNILAREQREVLNCTHLDSNSRGRMLWQVDVGLVNVLFSNKCDQMSPLQTPSSVISSQRMALFVR